MKGKFLSFSVSCSVLSRQIGFLHFIIYSLASVYAWKVERAVSIKRDAKTFPNYSFPLNTNPVSCCKLPYSNLPLVVRGCQTSVQGYDLLKVIKRLLTMVVFMPNSLSDLLFPPKETQRPPGLKQPFSLVVSLEHRS